MQLPALERSSWARPLAAGLLIAVAGPPLGFLPIVAWFALDQGEFSFSLLNAPPDLLLMPYIIGGGPALIAGAVAAWLIRRYGWVPARSWLVSTLVFALAPAALFVLRQPPSAAVFVPKLVLYYRRRDMLRLPRAPISDHCARVDAPSGAAGIRSGLLGVR